MAREEVTATAIPPMLVLVGVGTKTPPIIDGRSMVAPAPMTCVGSIVNVFPLTVTVWVFD
jgi:hypothetical protein